MSSLWHYIKDKYEENLELSDIDIDEIIEDLKDYNIDSIKKFEKRILYAAKWRDGVSLYTNELYAKKYGLDPNKFHDIDRIDYTDYLFFFHE